MGVWATGGRMWVCGLQVVVCGCVRYRWWGLDSYVPAGVV